MRIVPLDQVDLPFTPPALELFLARNGIEHRFEHLVADEMPHIVPRRKTIIRARSMLMKPLEQIGCDADVDGAVLRAGENIDARLALDHRERRLPLSGC